MAYRFPKSRASRRLMVGLLAAVCAALVTATLLVHNREETRPATALPSPAFSSNGESFYSEDQIEAVWAHITNDYPQPLPEGAAFPVKAPAIFVRGQAKKHIYQTGLPQEIAAQFWRCSWLQVALDPNQSPKHRSAARKRTTEFRTLPGIKGNPVFRSYDQKMRDLATREGLDPETAEFRANCGDQVFTQKGETK